ncbi:MAG: T9SS type A sorting domain-containing protein [Bacteroidia bacterium]
MKRATLLSFLGLFLGSYSFGQIVLTDDDLPERDKVYNINRVLDTGWWTNIADTVIFGQPGANQKYDFTNIKTLGFEPRVYGFGDAANFDFANEHPNANWANTNEVFTNQYRDPITFTSNDFPEVGDTFEYTAVKPNDVNMGNIGWYLDLEGGANQRLFFEVFEMFDDSAGNTITYVDPTTTVWGSDFVDADAAKVELVETLGNDTVVNIMGFYKEDNGDFVQHGIGAYVDKGYLLTQNPSKSYAIEDAKVTPAHRVHTTKVDWNNNFQQQTTWGASFTEGMFTLNHREINTTVDQNMGYGTMYMPNNDSFEFMQVMRYTFNASIDSIQMAGNLIQVLLDTSSMFEMLYYAKGYGEPIVKMEIDTASRLVLSCQYLDVENIAGISPLKTDTAQVLYGFYKREEGALSLTGLTAVLDLGSAFGDGASGEKDTLHAAFEKPQTIISTDMVYGFGFSDTITYSLEFDIPEPAGASVEIKVTEVRSLGVDGNGILLMNGDSASVIRVNTVKKETTETTIKLFGFPFQSFSEDDWSYELAYWGVDAQMPLVRAVFDTSDYAYAYECEFLEGPFVYVGKDETPLAKSFDAFPNPTTGTIQISGISENANIQVFDLNGKMIISNNASFNATLDMSAFEKGMYLLKVVDSDKNSILTKRIVKE